MHSITALNGCVGCGPSGFGYPTKIYGAPFEGLRAFDPKPLKTAMAVIGVLVAAGLAFAIVTGKKKKA